MLRWEEGRQRHLRFRLDVHSPTTVATGHPQRTHLGDASACSTWKKSVLLRSFFAEKSAARVIRLYRFLLSANVELCNSAFLHALKACAATAAALPVAKAIHSQVFRLGFCHDVYVCNSLVDMYAKSGCLSEARHLFDDMPTRNIVSWNTMASGYSINGLYNDALQICSLLTTSGLRLDKVGLKIVIPLCGRLQRLRLGQAAHSHVIASGQFSDLDLVAAIMDMYVKCECLDDAARIFNRILVKDVVIWNTMISGFSRFADLEKALELFCRMQKEDVKPSVVTALLALQACAGLAILSAGEAIHGLCIRSGLYLDISVLTLLIDMYSKSGKLKSAYMVFRGIKHKATINSWSAMISGFGRHGHGETGLALFFKMLQRGLYPDRICFVSLLSMCSHAGLVDDGWKCFNYMVHFGVSPSMEHYACVVDLLSRAGHLKEALEFVRRMPFDPDASIWEAIIGGCKIHSDLEMAETLRRHVIDLGPKAKGFYSLLISCYAARGDWNEVMKMRTLMQKRGVEKTQGWSLLEM
ncbi:Pentatricopeptide repeat-containing protein [Nymphaea thermarum]|nr:Pentatricopeptide repeat-containing protein [Nymphaea thermarum]